MRLILSREAYDHIREVVETHYPYESCGFFSGLETASARTINNAWHVENISSENQKRRFTINPLDYLKAESRAELSHEILQGVYHSHPDHPAIPSKHDLAKAMPFFSYIIASVQEGVLDKLTSWRLNEKHEFEEELIIVKP
jgi:proteasome lid subunit RPN8/RPN11